MKLTHTLILAVAIIAVGTIVVAKHPGFNARVNSVCIPTPGAAEEITATAAASDRNDSALSDAGRYVLTCDQDVWFRTCTSTSCTAASGDFPLGAGRVFDFGSGDTVTYMAARNITLDGSCWLVECQQ